MKNKLFTFPEGMGFQILIISIICISNIKLYSQVTDVKGWSNCLWGMNKMEILNIYPNSIVEKNNTLVKKEFVIDDYNFDIIFLFDSLHFKLNKIILSEKGNITKGSYLYKIFRKKIIVKYGPPVFTEEPEVRDGKEYLGSIDFTTFWFFPSSSIELQLTPIYSSQQYTLSIIYSQNSISDKL